MNKENNKAQIILTFQALKYNPTLSLKKVTSIYSVFLIYFFIENKITS